MKQVTSLPLNGWREQISNLIWAEWFKRTGDAEIKDWTVFWKEVEEYATELVKLCIQDGAQPLKSAENFAWNCAYDAYEAKRSEKEPECSPENPFWKDVEGYDGAYSVNYWGEVRSNRSGIRLSMRVVPRGKGYVYVSLWKDGKEKKYYVHRLVAQAFVPNPENKLTVNHKNGNTYHNSKDNLEWMTHQEQQDHAWATGLTNNRGENCGTSKLKLLDVSSIRAEYSAGGITQKFLAEKYGVTQPQISKIVNDKRWSEK